MPINVIRRPQRQVGSIPTGCGRWTLLLHLLVGGTGSMMLGGKAQAQSAVDSLQQLTSILGHEGLTAQCGLPTQQHAGKLAALLRALQSEQIEQQRKATLEVGAGISSDATSTESSLPATESHRADVTLSVRRGTYPGELGFFTDLGVSLTDGVFTENMSRLHTSYDSYINENLESYVFLDRLSDLFLSIDQRYEIGAGLVFDFHPVRELGGRSDLTARGEQRLAKVSDAIPINDTNSINSWLSCLGAVSRNANPRRDWIADSNSVLRLVPSVATEQRVVSQGIRKVTSRLRVALLIGAIAELERATISIKQEDATVSTPIPGTRTYRWSVRPTIVGRPLDALAVRVDWYYKRAFAGYRESFYPEADYRQDLRIALTADGDASGIGKLAATLEFRRLSDNAPPFDIMKNLVARRSHDRLSLRVSAKF